MTAARVQQELAALGSPDKAKASAWFFKTGPGQYGAGDQFLGVTVPEQRRVARQFRDLPLAEIGLLLNSPIHEYRLTGLLILVGQYQRASDTTAPAPPPRENQSHSRGDSAGANQADLVIFYLDHRRGVNNWDLVDSSAPQILGQWLLEHHRYSTSGDGRSPTPEVLPELARSPNLWERRIAIVTTQTFIRAGQFDDTLRIAEVLLHDPEDLIHKATGWMLREVGNRDQAILASFLDRFAATMPRTMLRYAIEKFSPGERAYYLKQKLTNRT